MRIPCNILQICRRKTTLTNYLDEDETSKSAKTNEGFRQAEVKLMEAI